MQTWIVTGGAGFIGSNFVRQALKQDDRRIVVLDKLTYAGHRCSLDELNDNERFVFVEADIADATAVAQIFEQYQPHALLNFAAETHVDRSVDGPRPFITTNIVGTFELLEAARKYVAQLDDNARAAFRFLHVSTDEVYGTLGETGLFSETTPYAPNSPYSASKAAADHLVRAYFETYGLQTLITNCSNNYGPFQFPEKLIPLTLLNALEGKPLPIYGDGGNVRDWLHVEDHCSAIALVLAKGTPGEKYNIGGGNERTNLQVVDALCDRLQELLPAAGNPALQERGMQHYRELKTFVADRPGHDRRYAIDANKIREELGWQPKYDFESGLAQTVRWYAENSEWCAQVQAGRYDRQRLGMAATAAA